MPRSIIKLFVALTLAAAAPAQHPDSGIQRENQSMREKNIQAMLEIFHLIETRDPKNQANTQRGLELLQPDVEFHWPPSLPYGGSTRGIADVKHPTWGETWTPLQPTEVERRMDPRVVAATEDEIVILWHQRGVSQQGERCDSEVLGFYRMRDGKLARAQMFYFDPVAIGAFLQRAHAEQAAAPK
jgi:ketosteroid isomerase-like protein